MNFSAQNKAFYDEVLKENYGESWPKDAIKIDDTLYIEIMKGQSEGKAIKADDKGYPILVEPEGPAIIPAITKRQAMLQLDTAGIYDSLLDFINQTENKKLKIEFEYSTSFERSSPFIIGMAKQFNLSDEQVDNLFTEAAKL